MSPWTVVILSMLLVSFVLAWSLRLYWTARRRRLEFQLRMEQRWQNPTSYPSMRNTVTETQAAALPDPR